MPHRIWNVLRSEIHHRRVLVQQLFFLVRWLFRGGYSKKTILPRPWYSFPHPSLGSQVDLGRSSLAPAKNVLARLWPREFCHLCQNLEHWKSRGLYAVRSSCLGGGRGECGTGGDIPPFDRCCPFELNTESNMPAIRPCFLVLYAGNITG